MADDFLGKGLKFPVQPDGRGGLAMSAGEEDVKEAIVTILATAPGERVMRPEFGCGLRDYVFEAVDSAVLGLVQTTVREALVRWEPRIEVADVTVKAEEDAERRLRLMIDIAYRVRTTNTRSNLVYPFYLREGR